MWGLAVPSCHPPPEKIAGPPLPVLASSRETLPSSGLHLCPPTVSACWFPWMFRRKAAGGATGGGGGVARGCPPSISQPRSDRRCSHLLPVSISSPVGPPALLPLYFQWYIFYFVVQRKKWVVSTRGPTVILPLSPVS